MLMSRRRATKIVDSEHHDDGGVVRCRESANGQLRSRGGVQGKLDASLNALNRVCASRGSTISALYLVSCMAKVTKKGLNPTNLNAVYGMKAVTLEYDIYERESGQKHASTSSSPRPLESV